MADVNTDLRCYLTNAGIAAENNSIQLGRSLQVAEMVFGSGLLPDSSDPRAQTSMIKEEYAVPCGMLFDDESPTLLVFKGDLPADVGGFHINEVAIRLESGIIYGYARGKGDYKPTLDQGATDSVRYAVEMYTTNADIIECKIDLSTVYADWEDLEAAIKAHEDKPDPHPQYLAALEHLSAENPHPQYPLAYSAQFLPYDPLRIYSLGEVCYTKTTDGHVQYWEWYSNVESLAGKDPLDLDNRQTGWTDETKPFYWTPHKKARAGTTLWPWMSMTIPEGTLNVVGNSVPVAVFWRVATALPELVNADTGMIDFPDARSEFFRVLDQSRGIDADRDFNSPQKGTLTAWNTGNDTAVFGVSTTAAGNGVTWVGADGNVAIDMYAELNLRAVGSSSVHVLPGTIAGGYSGATRPRNLAFPILIEV
ncbi:MAG: phage tail protein [Vibrio sp.]